MADIQVQRELDAICNEFEQNWIPGIRPDFGSYLSRVATEHREKLTKLLLDVDIELRVNAHQKVIPGEYIELGLIAEQHVQQALEEYETQRIDEGNTADSLSTKKFGLTDELLPKTTGPGNDAHEIPAIEPSAWDYEVIDEIARGGMGVVYKARQKSLNRIVALKMILGGQLAGEEERRRFHSEAEAAAKLDHPCIVPIYEIGIHDNNPFFSMGLVTGGSLNHLVKNNGPLEEKQAGKLLKSIAEGVHYAHSLNIVHRDLKPANVLIDENGNPKITDFGLAKNLVNDSQLTVTGQIMGTPSFMAPEQAAGRSREVGPLADVYALGAIFYHMLTCHPPFHGESPIETIRQVLDAQPTAPHQINSKVGKDVSTICLKCMEKSPARRYSSAAALVEELEAFIDGRPITARPVSHAERTLRWCRRNPLAAGIIGLSVATFFIFLLGMNSRQQLAAEKLINESQEQAVLAAKETARTHEYYAALNQAREIRTAGIPGWSWNCLKEVQLTTELIDADRQRADLPEIRSLAAESLSSFDVQPVKRIVPGVDAYVVAFSPNSSELAIGERKAGQSCRVHLVDLDNPESVRVLKVVNASANFGRLLKLKKSYADGISSIAYSPDGSWLAAGTRFGQVHLWKLGGREPKHTSWNAGETSIARLDFAPDSKILYAHYHDSKKIYRLQMESNSDLDPIISDYPISDFAVSRDGKSIAISDKKTRFLDANTLLPIEGFQQLPIGSRLSFSSDSRFLSIRQDGRKFQLVHVASGSVCQTLNDSEEPDLGIGYATAFAANDSLFLTIEDEPGIRIWDLASGDLIQTVPIHQNFDTALACCDERGLIAVGLSDGVQLLKYRSGQTHRAIAHSEGEIPAVAWVDPEQSVVTSSKSVRRNLVLDSISRWDVGSGKEINRTTLFSNRKPVFEPKPYSGFFSTSQNNSDLLMVHSNFGMFFLNSIKEKTQKPFLYSGPKQLAARQLTAEDLKIATSFNDSTSINEKVVELGLQSGLLDLRIPMKEHMPNGKSGQTWSIWVSLRLDSEIPTGAAIRLGTQLGKKKAVPTTIPTSLISSHDYQLYLVGLVNQAELAHAASFEAIVEFLANEIDTQSRVFIDRFVITPIEKRSSKQVSTKEIGPVDLAPSGNKIWALLDERNVCSWELDNPNPSTAWSDPVAGAILGDDILRSIESGKEVVAVGTRRGIAHLISVKSGKPVSEVAGPGGSVQALAIDSEQKHLVMGSETGVVRIWDMEKSTVVRDFSAHTRTIESIAFSPNGKLLASGSKDRTIRIWRRHSEDFEPLLTLRGLAGSVRNLQFSGDGSYLAATIKGERALRIWNLNSINQYLHNLGIGWN